MYPLKRTYSLRAYEAWRRQPDRDDLDDFTSSWEEVRDGNSWLVHGWDELRNAISFLTLMNKRDVLYFRGQGQHHAQCLPVLFRGDWRLSGEEFALTEKNRPAYLAEVPKLQDVLLNVVRRVGTPRQYILEHLPSAAAAVLQHYELWPTQFVDLTRTLPVALSFAIRSGDGSSAFLYVFAMPDLRGSITSDIDQHLTLARLEAVCPPAAKRPHHQDAYLASRFPEPPLAADIGGKRWQDWKSKTDLMRRLAARFELRLTDGWLPGAPRYETSFLIPPLRSDPFAQALADVLQPVVQKRAREFAA